MRKRGSVEVEDVKTYVVYALVEEEGEEEEVVLAGEEDTVFTCPHCGMAFIVEEGRVIAFRNMDDLTKYLADSMSHIFTIKKVRVKEW